MTLLFHLLLLRYRHNSSIVYWCYQCACTTHRTVSPHLLQYILYITKTRTLPSNGHSIEPIKTRQFACIGLRLQKQLQWHSWNVPFIGPLPRPLLKIFYIFAISYMSHYILHCLPYHCTYVPATEYIHYTTQYFISQRRMALLIWLYLYSIFKCLPQAYHWLASLETDIS